MRKEQTFTEQLGVRLWLYWVSQRNVCVKSRPQLQSANTVQDNVLDQHA